MIERVDLVVALGDDPGPILVGLDHRAEDLVHLRLGEVGHLWQVDVGLQLWQVVEPQGRARDPDGVVAHPLQFEHHVLKAHDQAQVARHRLLGSHDHEGALPKQAMQLIDVLIARDDFPGQRVVAIDQGPHRVGDRLLDHAAHANHA